ncbi:SIR2 family protein [uncultured Holdemanella sp.]|uniref:SIR2 family protein n=1 Tax=uncultured Holdemanella sp. TaxID=1763549 RepID=UPI0025FC1FC4|nr:SIR2 family protein [uncultured Holdemanella sp.]
MANIDIKEKMFDLLNNTKGLYSYIAIEKLVTVMITDYVKSQNKHVIENHYKGPDMILPVGIDDEEGCIAVEIKSMRQKQMSLKVIYDTITRFAFDRGEINKLLIIFVNELPSEIRERIKEKEEQLNFELIIWDIDDLVRIFSKNEILFFDTYNNLNSILLRDTVQSGIKANNDDYLIKRKKYIEQLKSQYKKDNIVLFVGAGASYAANIPTWNSLISELYVSLIDKLLKTHQIEINDEDKEKIKESVINQNGNSPLIQTRFLKNSFKENFDESVREILYKNVVEASGLLEEIGQLCIPNRGKLGIRAIIDYNFDDLIEKNLKRLRVKHQSIYAEAMHPDLDALGVYHVHGFLPQDKEDYNDLGNTLLVFSEDGYHKLMLDPYNWANISQLNFMVNNTCLFIGLSMTDPNMRRLLEIAAQKKYDDDLCQHYVIMRRFKINNSGKSESIKRFENVNESLQEDFFKSLGVNVIWVNDYDEIPNLLKQIKS